MGTVEADEIAERTVMSLTGGKCSRGPPRTVPTSLACRRSAFLIFHRSLHATAIAVAATGTSAAKA